MQNTNTNETSKRRVGERLKTVGDEVKPVSVAQHHDHNHEDVPKPPLPPKDEEYCLEAFGDISLSNIDFVPPAPSTLQSTPQKVAISKSRTFRRKPEMDTVARRPLLGSAHNTFKRPVTMSKARSRVEVRELLPFEGLVTTLKKKKSEMQVPDSDLENLVLGPTTRTPTLPTPKPKPSHSRSRSHSPGPVPLPLSLPEIRIHAPEPKRPINIKEFVAAAKDFDDFVVRCRKGVDEEDEKEREAEMDAEEVQRVLGESSLLRGSGKLPKRLPIPQWDKL